GRGRRRRRRSRARTWACRRRLRRAATRAPAAWRSGAWRPTRPPAGGPGWWGRRGAGRRVAGGERPPGNPAGGRRRARAGAPRTRDGGSMEAVAADDSLQHAPGAEEEIARILNETDVYIKYNLHAKAIEHLQRTFERNPRHIGAREKLKALYLILGRKDDAV